jgi:hypothetical protein
VIPSRHVINPTDRGLRTMEQVAKRRADTAIVLARMKQRFNLCVRVLTNAEWLAPSHEMEMAP